MDQRRRVTVVEANNPITGQNTNIGSLLAAPFQLASFVLWIVYWVKIAGYSRQLAEDDLRGDHDDLDDEDVGELPPCPSRPDDRIR